MSRILIAGAVWLTGNREAGLAAAVAMTPWLRNPLIRILGTPFSGRTLWDAARMGGTPLGGRSNPYVSRPGKYVIRHPGQVVALAVVGKAISNQRIAEYGGDVSGGWGAAPSKHLVGGRPWWE